MVVIAAWATRNAGTPNDTVTMMMMMMMMMRFQISRNHHKVA